MPRGLLRKLGGEPASGLSNRLIGEEMRISKATVKRHLANIYETVGVRSRNDAVSKALTEQWIGAPRGHLPGRPGRLGAPRAGILLPAYSPNSVEVKFSEVRTAPVLQ
jgi:hypothetical protein